MTTITGGPKKPVLKDVDAAPIAVDKAAEAKPAQALTKIAVGDGVDAGAGHTTLPQETIVPTAPSDLPKMERTFADLAGRVGERPTTAPAEAFALDGTKLTPAGEGYPRETEQATIVLVGLAQEGLADLDDEASTRLDARVLAWTLPLQTDAKTQRLGVQLAPAALPLFTALASAPSPPQPAPVLRLRRALEAATDGAPLPASEKRGMAKLKRLALVKADDSASPEAEAMRSALATLPPITLPDGPVLAFERSARQLGAEIAATADVEALLQIVLFECERLAGADLKDAVNEMRACNEKKKAQRQFMAYLKRQEAAMKADLRQEYDRRAAIPPPDLMHIDTKTLSFDDFCESQKLMQKSGDFAGPGDGVPPDPDKSPVLGLSPNKTVYDYDVKDSKGRALSVKELQAAQKLGISPEDMCDLKDVWGSDGELRGKFASMNDWLTSTATKGVSLTVPPRPNATKQVSDYIGKWKTEQAKKNLPPPPGNVPGLDSKFPGVGAAVLDWLQKVYDALGSPGGDFEVFLKAAPPDGVGLKEMAPLENETAYNAFCTWLKNNKPLTYSDGTGQKTAKDEIGALLGKPTDGTLPNGDTDLEDDRFKEYIDNAGKNLPPPGKDAIDEKVARYIATKLCRIQNISAGNLEFGDLKQIPGYPNDPRVAQYVGLLLAEMVKDLKWSTAHKEDNAPFRNSCLLSRQWFVVGGNHLHGIPNGTGYGSHWFHTSDMKQLVTSLTTDVNKLMATNPEKFDTKFPSTNGAKLDALLGAPPDATGPGLISGDAGNGGGNDGGGDNTLGGAAGAMGMAFSLQPSIKSKLSLAALEETPGIEHFDGLNELSLRQLDAEIDAWKGKMDSTGDLSDELSLKLQATMDRRKKFLETLSNVMKKLSDTGQAITQNLK
ncbi:MAG: hypothetical protein IT381_24480 [Deltaproteobacteria bacterium]|nr:hypothetical protein [Deltaproteobacteria bacterium]